MEVVEKKRAVILNPNEMQQREVFRQCWAVNAEAGTLVEDVLDPQYWAHVAVRFEPFARVEVVEETGAWMLDLLVVNYARTWAQVHVLHRYDLARVADEAPSAKYRVDWKGPGKKHCVIRITDGAIVQEGISEKAAAFAAMASYEKTIG